MKGDSGSAKGTNRASGLNKHGATTFLTYH